MMFLPRIALVLTMLCAACGNPPPAADAASSVPPQDAFLGALQHLCGQAFEGSIVESSPVDTIFAGRTLVMHVRQCEDDALRIPFHVGDDRSRTWIISRTETGLRLKHDHRHEDGSEDTVTQYGGDTVVPGTAERQEFPADNYTAELLPVASTNIWTVEILPGRSFAYALRREGTDRRFRVEFDLTRPVPAPPAPWGY